MVPRNIYRGHLIRQVHQTGREGEPSIVQHGDEVLAETVVREEGTEVWASRSREELATLEMGC